MREEKEGIRKKEVLEKVYRNTSIIDLKVMNRR